MLASISPYVERYSNLIATVTNINVEVADCHLIRIAGTGMYSEGVGQSIGDAGQLYRHVLANKQTAIMRNPRLNELCQDCVKRNACVETLSLCTPIVYNNKVLGVIGIVCFTTEERERILSRIDVYKDFVEQMASALSFAVGEDQRGKQTEHLLDTFLQITDSNNRGILTINAEGMITYLNDTARKELGINDKTALRDVTVRKTGDTLSGMEEFECLVAGKQVLVLGHLSYLNSQDETFHAALAFDTLPEYRKMLSHTSVGHGAGGLGAIIGNSKKILELKQQVIHIARTSSTVLITGESGTGKEMFARAVHAESDRADKPFVPINCGAIPDSLLESELFGYVSGAFTGASPAGHMGKFEMAHQGVLFLDEIGAMPIYLQVKLLRVLQDRTIMRLGSNRTIKVDVRIIAATNDQLQELIEQRMFREDLYYRLNVIPLRTPPLRERLEDVSALASFFLEKYCRLFSKKPVRPTVRMLDALKQYSWPGNVREFENIMEYLVNILPNGGSATVSMLPAKILNEVAKQKASLVHPALQMDSHGGYPRAVQAVEQDKATLNKPFTLPGENDAIISLADLEREAIRDALMRYGTDVKSTGTKAAGISTKVYSTEVKQRVADALGIGIATLYRKLKLYDLGQ